MWITLAGYGPSSLKLLCMPWALDGLAGMGQVGGGLSAEGARDQQTNSLSFSLQREQQVWTAALCVLEPTSFHGAGARWENHLGHQETLLKPCPEFQQWL